MKKLHTTLIQSLIVFSLSTAAYAKTPMIVFVDENGKAEFTSSPVSIEEVNQALGLDNNTPKDGKILIIEDGKKPIWTEETVSEIDKRYDGDGSPKIKLPIVKPNKSIDLDDIPEKKTTDLDDIPEKKPAEIFDNTGAIQPEDGTWQLSVTSNTYDGCPADPFPPKSITGMTRPVTINWDTPWKPTPFYKHYPAHVKFNFKQTSPTQWHVTGVLQKTPGGGVSLVQDFTLSSPKEINVKATITMKMNVAGMKINCQGHLKMIGRKK